MTGSFAQDDMTHHSPLHMIRRLVTLALVLPMAVFAQAPVPAGTPVDPAAWRIDKTHSELTFQIRHFMSRVRGTFRDWKGSVSLSDPAKWESAAINVRFKGGASLPPTTVVK